MASFGVLFDRPAMDRFSLPGIIVRAFRPAPGEPLREGFVEPITLNENIHGLIMTVIDMVGAIIAGIEATSNLVKRFAWSYPNRIKRYRGRQRSRPISTVPVLRISTPFSTPSACWSLSWSRW